MSGHGDVSTGDITFVDRYQSVLPDGAYEVLVGHRAASVRSTAPAGQSAEPDPEPFDETYVSRQRITVEGPRFSLPPDMITAHFPPVEGTGKYEAVLPHVVLRRKTLPWERSASPGGSNNGLSWLAVLVFHASDMPSGRRLPWEARSASVNELCAPEPGVISYPHFAVEGDESTTDRCQLIDIPAALWSLVAPRVADLAWLAHARVVTTPVEDAFSVVVANRLPHANEHCTAHLVSLEGMRDLLPGGAREPKGGVVRLISLASWGFTSQDTNTTFTGYIRQLHVGPLQLPPTAGQGAAADEAHALVARAFDLGYTAKGHLTRAGDRTVSWYRGPLVPIRSTDAPFTPVIQPGEPIHTADELVRYDPHTGMLDVTYAAAWQLGRLLMLQNTSVAVALAEWKHGNLLQAAVAFERERLSNSLGFLALPAELARATDGHVATIHRAGASWLSDLRLEGQPGPRDAALPAGRRAYLDPASNRDMVTNFHDEQLWNHYRCADPVPPTVTLWLARLQLLFGVPLTYLIADMHSLPGGSLRVFEVDRNWVDALVEGAFSIGRSSKAVAAHDSVHHTVIRGARDTSTPPAEDAVPDPLTGCLLHSGVVIDWPKLEIRASDGDGTALPLLRMERLAPRILFCLFDGRVNEIELREPPEGLHFGLEPEGSGAAHTFRKPVRSLDGHGTEGSIPVPFHNEPERVVDVDRLAQAIRAKLPATEAFGAADFAVEMVEGVQSVRFVASAPAS